METSSTPQTTLTEVTTPTPSPSPNTRTQTQSERATPYTHTMSSSLPSTPSTESTSENTGHTTAIVTQSSAPASTEDSMTPSAQELSTVPTLSTSTQELSTPSQNHQSESMETSSTPQPTLTEVSPPTPSHSPSGSSPAQSGSKVTSSPVQATNPSSSSVTNRSPATSEMLTTTPSTASSPGSTTSWITQNSVTATEISMTSSAQELSTVSTPIKSTGDLSTSSQNDQSESMETSSTPQTTLIEASTPSPSHSPSGSTLAQSGSQNDQSESMETSSTPQTTLTEVTTPTPSPSPSVSTPAQTGSQVTSVETTNPSSSSVTNTFPATSEKPTTAPFTDSAPCYQQISSHTRGANHSSLYSLHLRKYRAYISTKFLLCDYWGANDKFAQCPVNIVNTHHLYSFSLPDYPSTATSDVFSATYATSVNTVHTPTHASGSPGVVTSRDSTLAAQSTILADSTSTLPSSTHSQSHHSTSMTTSSISQTSTLTEMTTQSHLSSSPGPNMTDIPSHGTSSSGMTTSSLKTDSDRGTSLSVTSVTFTAPSSSTASRSTVSSLPSFSEQGISLFPYGTSPQVGDQQFFARTVDFTSRLFKLQIGFPLGSSLRDSFYFTDNGQIIFPESDYSIFSYPNPPQSGFTGKERVAMVAPFWGDADFSSSRGVIFHQEYNTLYGENIGLVREVETLINEFTGDWTYKAKWTLKVTWVNVPAYPAQWSYGTNTYQAILSTDGSSSYALFLYQSGGMQWNVIQGLGNQVLMGFSSGDGYFGNSPLTFQPATEKYRPDRFLNSKLGIRGVQVYRLHKEVRPNYRLKCLWWLNNQPPRPSWSWGWSQLSCPCSWQQGLWDFRFWRMTGWWNSGSRQLCSFSSWRGGVCCSYGRWGEFREGWRMHSLWQFEQEQEAQKWCCHLNDKPSFCVQYHHRRPRVSCAWYRPPRFAWTYGDPHITTLDNATYTFNGLGDFLLVQAQDTNSSFLLEGRTAQTGSAKATNFIAFAAQYNTNSLASPITVQWFLEPNDTVRVLLNNQTVAFNTSQTDEGLPMFNTTGILLTHNGSQVSASFDGTVAISVIALSNILHASTSLPEEYRNHTRGLLGVWNDDPEDDFRMPNGSTIPRNSSEETIFHYGMTWQINGTGLLGLRTDPLPSNFTPIFLSQLLSTSNESMTLGCKGDVQCVFDALATGNATTGQNTNAILKTFQHVNGTLNQYPPSVNCPNEIRAYKGKTEIIEITSNSKDVTFNLTNQCSGFKLLENGSLQWTPTLPEVCILEILATDARTNLSSILQPRTVACFCSVESQCFYSETSREGNASLEVTSCKCDGDTFGRFCERSKNHCEEPCFPNVSCIPGKGCEACPPNMTGDGRHCAALEDSLVCQNHSCPVNYCYNHGHCYISGAPDCQPTCTCPPAFTDSRCFLAGNNFTPTVYKELPFRTIELSLRENENASRADVNASVAYRLETLDMRAFLWNSLVELTGISLSAQSSNKPIQHWRVVSNFQYRPRGPVIHFLNNHLIDAVVEAFLLQTQTGRQKKSSEEARKDVTFFPISRADIQDVTALNLSMLNNYFLCEGYKNYSLVYSPQNGVTCVSPCSEGYCHNGGQCQHLPDGPQCSCASFTIYTSWGEHCEHLSVKLGAFFGILFGTLGALLLLGISAFAIFHFCGCSSNKFSYPLDSVL
ncbi:mucin-4 [Phodopus roborovskii]|uniref:mucin-4 n=1 Tax=Phodopus roborovskii TaxID=109678 RepID=UPI0021E4581D|nr:mucin-4 [Phodopus roborovskii]